MDDIDAMLEREERIADLTRARSRAEHPQRSSIYCVSCGEEIPAARRAVSASCLCVDCLEEMERGMGR